jgi:addiction module RelE/StbE family toxin
MGQENWRVILTPRALRDLEEIVHFIASDNPGAAERFCHRLIVEAEAIAPHPLAGRMVPEFRDPNIRERIFHSYRIVYRVDASTSALIVSRFWHSARDTPDLEPE